MTAINDYLQVAGSIYPNKGFIWTPAYPNSTSGHLTTIAPLFHDGELDLYDINPSGVAVGTSFGRFHLFRLPGTGNDYAVVWRPAAPNGTAGKLLVLGVIGRDADSHAEAINSSGEVVGFSCTERHDIAPLGCSTLAHLFIWDDTHGLHDLQGLLDPDAGMTLGGSIATIASTSDAGQIVTVGQAPDGQTHLLLLTPQL